MAEEASEHNQIDKINWLDLGQIIALHDDDKFWAARGKSIAAYARVELSLRNLFSYFSGMDLNIAGAIFFRITNPRIQGEIFDIIIHKKHPNIYSDFWRSIAKRVQKLVGLRNSIVHWGTTFIIASSDGYTGMEMEPLEYIYEEESDRIYEKTNKPVRTEDLIEFIKECEFISEVCKKFYWYLAHPEVFASWPEEIQKPWLEIFQKPIVYPPPDTHPIFQTLKAPYNPPPPSPASPQSPNDPV